MVSKEKTLPPVPRFPDRPATAPATAPAVVPADDRPVSPTRLPKSVRSRTSSSPFAFKERGKQLASLAKHANGWRKHRLKPSPSSNSLGLGINTPWGKRSASTPASPNEGTSYTTVLGIKVPKDDCPRFVFGRTLRDAALSTRLASPGNPEGSRDSQSTEDPKAQRQRERTEAKAWLPALAIRCLDYVEMYADQEEGLYRVPGSNHQVQQLKLLFDAGLDLDLRTKSTSDLDPHSVASLFKLWLRELPETILTPTLEPMLDRLMLEEIGTPATSKHSMTMGANSPSASAFRISKSSADPPQDLLDKMCLLISTLPLERWHLLREVANHLHILDSFSDHNKMTLSNLRLILSPTLHVSPALLQILVERRNRLFDKERANQLATPSASPHSSNHPQSVQSDQMARFPSYTDSLAIGIGSAPATLSSVLQKQQDTSRLSPLPQRSVSVQSTPTPISQKFSSTSLNSSYNTQHEHRPQTPASPASSNGSFHYVPQRNPNVNFFSNGDSKPQPRKSSLSTASIDPASGTVRRINSIASLRAQTAPPPAASAPAIALPPEPSRSTPELVCGSSIETEDDQLSDPQEEVIEVVDPPPRIRVPSLAPSLSLAGDLDGGSLLDGFTAEKWLQGVTV